MRVPQAPEPPYDRSRHYHEASPLKARWVAHPHAPTDPNADAIFVARYAVAVEIAAETVVRVHVSADERYVLRLDGRRLGRGPERGTRDAWCLDAYDLALPPGRHVLSADVHSFGRHRPYAQESVRHAFLLLAEGEHGDALSTGLAAWTARHVDAYAARAVELKAFVATGARCTIDGRALLTPVPALPAVKVGPTVLASMRMESPGQWQLVPAALPPMIERPVPAGTVRHVAGPIDAAAWQALLSSAAPVTIPPRTSATALIDLRDYFCADTRLIVRGGANAMVTVEWAEAMFEADGRTKRHRDAVDGLHFFGTGDALLCPGGDVAFEPLWWSAGRYVRVAVVTADAPLTLDRISLVETRYPTTWDSEIELDHPAVAALTPLARRAMEACSHETFYDCPYYEQLMYSGDTRLEALVTFAHSRDDRLPRKAVQLFDRSRGPGGWTQARCPTKTSQIIPPFAWAWVAMVHDLAMWRDRPHDVAAAMPGVRAVMEASYAATDADDLYAPVAGWHYVDWADGWAGGVPPGGATRPTASIHFQLACAAAKAADLETIAGEPLLAERHRLRHARLTAVGRAAFFDADAGLFADDVDREHFSEHASALAVLAGVDLNADERRRVAERLSAGDGLTRATIYFSHYVFEALRELDRVEAIFERLSFWAGLAGMGFKTTPEKPEPSRSDCHGWGAHPLFHGVATILGVRPAAAGFARVRIEPKLGPLDHASGRIVHPAGTIGLRAWREGERLRADVQLPAGVGGELWLNGMCTPITPGSTGRPAAGYV